MNFNIIGKLVSLRILSAVLGLVYAALQVRILGASAEMDAYFIATTGLFVITSLTQSGQLAEVFLPEYIRLKQEKGQRSAFRLFSAMINRMMTFSLLIFLILFLLAPILMKLLGSGLRPELEETAAHIFRASICLVFFILTGSFTNTVLNAEKIYGRVELNSLLNGIISIGLLIAIGKEIGAWVLLISLLAGKIVEFCISFLLLYRIGYRHQWCWSTIDFNFKRLFIVLIPTSGYVAATQFYIFTMTHFASFLPEGIFSLFKYVGQIGQKTSSMIIDPLSSVFFSEFAHKIKETGDSLNNFIQKPLIFILIISWSSLLACMLTGLELLQVLWSEKSLTTEQFSYCELALILSFAAYAIGNPAQLFRKAAISLGGAQRLYAGWIVTQIISAVLAGISISEFGQQGLLWIPVINMALMAIISMVTAHRKGIKIASILRFNDISKFLSFFMCMAALTAFMEYFIPSFPPLTSAIIKLSLFGSIFIAMVSIFFRNEVLTRIPRLIKLRNPFIK